MVQGTHYTQYVRLLQSDIHVIIICNMHDQVRSAAN
uniref:Uncharacterized protein n=1 Tax=Rhizophora mucronata TaxID=61149 RepID=A0A2P2NVC2_RHIMU